MLYCTKCRSICENSVSKCPNCRNARLREVNEDDYVLLHTTDLYTAQRLASIFEEHSVEYHMEKFDGGRISYLYDSTVMPTDKSVYVRYGDFSVASVLTAQVEQKIQEERVENGGTLSQDMPRTKRIIIQSLSIIAFLLLVMLAVFGADAFAKWLKTLLGM